MVPTVNLIKMFIFFVKKSVCVFIKKKVKNIIYFMNKNICFRPVIAPIPNKYMDPKPSKQDIKA